MPDVRRDPDDLAALREASDVLGIDGQLSPDERGTRERVRAFVDSELRPHIADWFDRAHFPVELAPELGRLGVLGMELEGYGCPGRSAVEYGLAALELEAGDSGIRTFVSVQGSLAMGSIHRWGSEEQKQEWLPRMAAGEVIGAFGLTEPGAGSDPSSMTTFARRDGDDWVIKGAKRWIGLASIAQLAVVWAQTHDGVRGFIVPTDAAGLGITVLEPKGSMRASVQTALHFEDVRVPASALLPGARGLRGPFSALNDARYGIVWGALGAARDSYEAALRHALRREQFGQPIAGFQLTQRKLVDMVVELQKGALVALQIGRAKDAGTLTPTQISLGKLNNVREAIEIAREARTILGGDGVLLENSPIRHAANLESVRTYEGTDEVHTLVLGQHLTGLGAFR
ncbi:acyl-CoA dehydrogenase family protein [Microbacterium trichothecenolyticum]|uniref:acyl-CoA dehydrogenase family protein n=1 Tax=Microbacterium trichothecenolyticum TaxID=69370 RepID=UPI001C6E2338|nr:acyl-CoA dehydrogenase family protein [Microbacterium trichothecenolyticum]MBW9120156.1 acyl-CoA dehydrogenase family protein [Microbacterium trichothecenolyticum]